MGKYGIHIRLDERSKILISALAISNAVCVLLYAGRILATESTMYWFLLWNLFLAWLPLVFAYALHRRLRHGTWATWPNLVLAVLWLGFLPNSFYLVSDLIHLESTGQINILYDAVMFTAFIFNGFIGGFLSIFMLHRDLIKRIHHDYAHTLIGLVLLACGFAIYLGRYMRWNTWDVLTNPLGVIFDVSDSVINPVAHPQVLVTTVSFFLLLGMMYYVIWQAIRAIRHE